MVRRAAGTELIEPAEVRIVAGYDATELGLPLQRLLGALIARVRCVMP